jgi:hypothetical protein
MIKKSVVLYLPRGLRAALKNEAAREGVGVNQLAIAKLAINLRPSAMEKSARSTRRRHVSLTREENPSCESNQSPAPPQCSR